MIDHEYFSGVSGSTITAKGSIVTVQVQVSIPYFINLCKLSWS